MFEQPMRTDQVFGISTEVRPVSYVDRGELDSDIQTYLARNTHIAIRGESKCGKSWFRQKNIANPIVVQCRLGRTVNDLFVDALSQLDIRLEVQSLKSSAVIRKSLSTGRYRG
jgi:hypothetical protein